MHVWDYVHVCVCLYRLSVGANMSVYMYVRGGLYALPLFPRYRLY